MTISGYRVGYNTLDTPLLADNQGHVIAGRSYGLVLATCDHVRAAYDRNELALLPTGAEPSGGQADAELARFAAAEANADAMAPYDRQVLAGVAEAVGVDVTDGPNKAELVARLAVLDPFPGLPPLEGDSGESAPAPGEAVTESAVPWTPPDTDQPGHTAAETVEPDSTADEVGEQPKPASRRTRKAAR